jgi:hypothetical protein
MKAKYLILPVMFALSSAQAELAENPVDILQSDGATLKKSDLAFVEVIPCSDIEETGWCVDRDVKKGRVLTVLIEDAPCTAVVGEATTVETELASFFQGAKIEAMTCSFTRRQRVFALIDSQPVTYVKASPEQMRMVEKIALPYIGSKNNVCSGVQESFILDGIPIVEILSCTCETDACGSTFYEVTKNAK